jgi:hypothetical protein
LAWHISLQDVEFFHAFRVAHQWAHPDTQWPEAAIALLFAVNAPKRIKDVIAIRARALLMSTSSAFKPSFLRCFAHHLDAIGPNQRV